jgi:DNA-directed RNA polymerase specialized sigma24 family protein
MELEQALKYAKRVAFRMSKDPEVESLAGVAAWRAVRTYNPLLNVPMERWVARCVKTEVWCYWRKLRCRPITLKDDTWWESVHCVIGAEDAPPNPRLGAKRVKPEAEELPIPREDHQLLCEYYLDKWPLDVLARRHEVTIPRVKKLLRAAVARLKEAVNAR